MSTMNEINNPGVIARPTRLFLAALGMGLVLDYFKPVPWLPNTVQYPVGLMLIAGGVALLALAFRRFRNAGTNVPTYLPAKAVVTDGPYRLSRNPIYLGLVLIFLGLAVAIDSVWLLALLVPLLVIMHYGVIRREERYLEAKFGEPYLAYKNKVRRWF